MAATKFQEAFLKGYGSILTVFPSKQQTTLRFIYKGNDIRSKTSEQALQETWESVGAALTTAMLNLPKTDEIVDESK